MGRIEKSGMDRSVAGGFRIAVYIRLSKADVGTGQEESNSISMQRILIHNYIASHFADCRVEEYQEM